MRPAGTPEQLERRRRQAIAQVKAGHTLSAVARQFSASVSSVHRWWQAYAREGPRGLRPKPTPGRPSRLSAGQKGEAGHAAGPWAAAGRVPYRPLDVAAGGRGDPPAVRRSLSSRACVETPDRLGLELSETRAAGRRAGRTGHRPVEAGGVAPDKKTPPAGAPTS